ncbi:MAG: M23 family metallopeptidase [Bacteroidaceae bacterium]
MKRYIYVCIVVCSVFPFLSMMSQKAFFSRPMNIPLYLSGNFGELRSTHFHGGLDFKTGGSIGKPVYALSEGYIWRARVINGSGYVLDIRYNNGYSTTYRHLSRFIQPIAQRIEDIQYKEENWEVEFEPKPNEYPVKAGQLVAWSGNTGYSFGPHLHVDFFDTKSGDYLDPLPFLKRYIIDKRAPQVQGIAFFPQQGQGVVDGSEKVRFVRPRAASVYAWGLIGVGLKAYDYMNGVYNKYGVKSVALSVDGKVVFYSLVDRFSYDENRMVKSWIYDGYMKSFVDPGNSLRMIHAMNGNRGLIDIKEERDYHFVYTLKDALGNTSFVRFTVHGRRQNIPAVKYSTKYLFVWDRGNYLRENGMSLVVPKGSLFDNVYLDVLIKQNPDGLSPVFQLCSRPVPLLHSVILRMDFRQISGVDFSKYYIAEVSARGAKRSVGGVYQNGIIKADIIKLSTYTVAVDTIAPVIIPLQKNRWGRLSTVSFRLFDSGTGIRSYRGTIDGKFALFGRPNITTVNWQCKLDSKRVIRGRNHIVRMTVIDNCGNESTSIQTFYW